VIATLLQGHPIRTAPGWPLHERKSAVPGLRARHRVDRSKDLAVLVLVQAVLQAPDGILDLALDLVDATLSLEFFVTGDLSGRFLDLAAQIFGSTVNAIIVGHGTLLTCTSPD
jgi:hypothetical protein